VLDGEAVAVDAKGHPLPFQDLMRRFRRVRDIEATIAEVPLQLYLFDVLYSTAGHSSTSVYGALAGTGGCGGDGAHDRPPAWRWFAARCPRRSRKDSPLRRRHTRPGTRG